MNDLSIHAEVALRDPNLDSMTLAQIAAVRPDLYAAILQHPNCYPELSVWIRGRLPQVPAPPPPAPTPAPPSPAPTTPAPPEPTVPLAASEWAVHFQTRNGREATFSEYQEAVTRGEIIKEGGQPDASLLQMKAGAAQLGAGAKEFFQTRIAPAASGAAESARTNIGQGLTAFGGITGWSGWALIALPIAAVLGMIGLSLPLATAGRDKFNFFSEEFGEVAGGEGAFLLFGLLLVAAAAVVAIIVKKRWARITAGVTGIVVGIFVGIDALNVMSNIKNLGSYLGLSVGSGTVLLLFSAVVMIAASVLSLIPQKSAA